MARGEGDGVLGLWTPRYGVGDVDAGAAGGHVAGAEGLGDEGEETVLVHSEGRVREGWFWDWGWVWVEWGWDWEVRLRYFSTVAGSRTDARELDGAVVGSGVDEPGRVNGDSAACRDRGYVISAVTKSLVDDGRWRTSESSAGSGGGC